MLPPCARLLAVSCARRSAQSCPRAVHLAHCFPTAHAIAPLQSRCFESSARRRDAAPKQDAGLGLTADADASTAPPDKPYRALGPVDSNVYELVPIAAQLSRFPYVQKIRSLEAAEVFTKRRANILSQAVRCGGVGIDRAINILMLPHGSREDKITLAKAALQIRAAVIAHKVLQVLQPHVQQPHVQMPGSGGRGARFLSDEQQAVVQDFANAVDARLVRMAIKPTHHPTDPNLVILVSSLRKQFKEHTVKASKSKEQDATPKPVEEAQESQPEKQDATSQPVEQTPLPKPVE
jgi:hypothetical protein